LNVRTIFFTDAGALRAPWRIGVFSVASTASLIVCAVVLSPIITQLFALAGIRGVTNEAWVEAAGLLGGTAICLRWIDKRPWSDVWLDRGAARPSLLAIGFALGAACIGLPILGLIASGWLREVNSGLGSWWGATVRITLLLLPAALLEELLTRGYILSVLREWWGWRWAIFATSVGFGLLHLTNNGANAESVALVTLAGVFLAGVLYATRSLYAAWMAHFAWNWTMAAVFHASVSGYPFEAPSYRYVDAGPDWATGGDWGPEGGMPAALGMGAGIAVLYGYKRSRPSNLPSRASAANEQST
jgi:membrane protease YdiL (CAAX protease family)